MLCGQEMTKMYYKFEISEKKLTLCFFNKVIIIYLKESFKTYFEYFLFVFNFYLN